MVDADHEERQRALEPCRTAELLAAKWSGRNAVAVPPPPDPVDEAERLLADALRDD